MKILRLAIVFSLPLAGNVAVAQVNEKHEVLYNGIVLPAIWPPENMDPLSDEPMTVPYLKQIPNPININVGRQLFVDDFLIENTTLQRVFHQARKYEHNPVFFPQTRQELMEHHDNSAVTYLGHGGVFYDPAVNEFKMFYTAGWRGGLAIATSADLVEWERPSMGLFENNMVLPPGSQMAGGDNSVWLDLNETDSTQRYKAIFERLVDGGWSDFYSNKTDAPTHTLHYSADGRIWSNGVVTGRAADYTSIFYNPFRKVWVFSIKQNTKRGRARYYAESPSFFKGASWKNSVYWTNADRLDEPDPEIKDAPQLYSLNAVAYESILLGEFYIHLGPTNAIAEKGRFPKITELKLGFSRDGFHWSRPDRRPFINATRKEGDWDRAYLHGTTGVCLVMGDELWFPYCGYSGKAPDGSTGMYTGAAIGMAILRRDGFASMQTSGKGTLTTRPVIFDGAFLFVNVDCPSGSLQVEILDEQDKIIHPFSAKNSVWVKADNTIFPVRWKGAEDLSALKGKPVKFRFTLSKGHLYSFWVSPDKNGASYGYLGAGGPGYSGVIDDKGMDAKK